MSKLLGNLKEGLFFIISGPGGSGKNTLVNLLKSEFLCVEETVSCTTRLKREQEKDGYEYFFISHEDFQKKIKEHAFLEHSQVVKDNYGTLKSEVTKIQAQGKHVIAVIEVKGAAQIRKQKEVISIFILPPSLDVLRKRLQDRKSVV